MNSVSTNLGSTSEPKPLPARYRARKYSPQNFSRSTTLNLLRRFEPMASFDWHSLATLARLSNQLTVPANRLLVRPPRRLDGVWYLCSGTVRNEATGERFVAGSRRCRVPIYPGQTSLRSISVVRLLRFDATAARLFRLHDDFCDERDRQNSLGGDLVGDRVAVSLAGASSQASWLEVLAASPVLRLLYHRRGASGWQSWLRALEPIDVAHAQQLIAPGVVGNSFYVVQSGIAIVEEERAPKARVALATVAAGGFFGEDSVLTGLPRNARVHMPLGGRVLRGDAQHLRALVDDLWWVLAREPASWTSNNEPLQFSALQDSQRLRRCIAGLAKSVDYGLCIDGDEEQLDLALLLLVHRGYRVRLRAALEKTVR